MFEHKHPGKGTHAGHAGHGQDHGHAPGPGKRTLVEQEGHGAHGDHGAIASAASLPADPQIGASKSAKITIHQGQVKTDTSVTFSLAHGKGPISLELSKGTMSVGNDHMSFDIKSARPATGHGLGLGGVTGAAVSNTPTQKSAPTATADGYLGITWTTFYTIKTHAWTATLSYASFVATKRPPPEKHHGIGKVIHAIEKVAEAALHDIVDAAKAIVNSSPDWGPTLVHGLEAAAAAGVAIVVVG